MDNKKPAVMISMDMMIEKYTNPNLSRIDLRTARNSRNSMQDLIDESIDEYALIPRSDSEVLTYIENHREDMTAEGFFSDGNLAWFDNFRDAVTSYAYDIARVELDEEIYNAGIKALTAQYFKDCKVYTVPVEIWYEVLTIAQNYEPDGRMCYLADEVKKAINSRISVKCV